MKNLYNIMMLIIIPKNIAIHLIKVKINEEIEVYSYNYISSVIFYAL